MKSQSVNYPLLFVVGIVICLFTVVGLQRLDIDTDIVKSLPNHEQVIVDALEIFDNHPIHDQVAVDIMIDTDDPDLLVECGAFLQDRMRASGLFSEVGMGEVGALIPELANQIARDLPLLFSQEDLEKKIAPRLQKDWHPSTVSGNCRRNGRVGRYRPIFIHRLGSPRPQGSGTGKIDPSGTVAKRLGLQRQPHLQRQTPSPPHGQTGSSRNQYCHGPETVRPLCKPRARN